jgi:hypothetical protein
LSQKLQSEGEEEELDVEDEEDDVRLATGVSPSLCNF